MVISVRFSLLSYSVIDNAEINDVRKSGLTIHKSLWLGIQEIVLINRHPWLILKESISTFGRDKRNQLLCTGVRINRP